MELEIGQIMEILPHRQPFLLIDAVEELEPENARWRENASATTNLISEDISRGTGDARGTDCRGTGADRCGGDFKHGGEPWKDRVFCGD